MATRNGTTGKLTAKQQRFVEEYLVDPNGTQAAMRAGYSPDTARAIASKSTFPRRPFQEFLSSQGRTAAVCGI